MLQEFKEFALKGNVVDLAVGIIIGAAFTTIVTSLVDDILMPPIGVLMGGIDFSDKYIQLTNWDQSYPSLAAARDAGAAVMAYGNFINAVIKFVIVAFALFIVIKQMNNLKRMTERKVEEAPKAPEVPADVALLTEIRDLLKKNPAT
ncbi:large conductance mechanosensitive channel protein MscL [Geminicoccus roseus]|uniref:large conductance mechanosensitive channel protein MscL n=1 Tax=Geminicoccus roseus TaxID=404900 RepID=UPI000481505C|nr:large conductance mechanosensitive channel protein MscL [Geminicoccus roseus]